MVAFVIPVWLLAPGRLNAFTNPFGLIPLGLGIVSCCGASWSLQEGRPRHAGAVVPPEAPCRDSIRCYRYSRNPMYRGSSDPAGLGVRFPVADARELCRDDGAGISSACRAQRGAVPGPNARRRLAALQVNGPALARPAAMMDDSDVTTLILPGLGNSSPEHWQSYWEREDASCRRVVQADWDTPVIVDFRSTTFSAAVARGRTRSCSWPTARRARWSRIGLAPRRPTRWRACVGRCFVAPSDPDGPNYPTGPIGFSPVPLIPSPSPASSSPARTTSTSAWRRRAFTRTPGVVRSSTWAPPVTSTPQVGSGDGPWGMHCWQRCVMRTSRRESWRRIDPDSHAEANGRRCRGRAVSVHADGRSVRRGQRVASATVISNNCSAGRSSGRWPPSPMTNSWGESRLTPSR